MIDICYGSINNYQIYLFRILYFSWLILSRFGKLQTYHLGDIVLT